MERLWDSVTAVKCVINEQGAAGVPAIVFFIFYPGYYPRPDLDEPVLNTALHFGAFWRCFFVAFSCQKNVLMKWKGPSHIWGLKGEGLLHAHWSFKSQNHHQMDMMLPLAQGWTSADLSHDSMSASAIKQRLYGSWLQKNGQKQDLY